MRNLAQAFDELVPQAGDIIGMLFQVFTGILQGSGHGADTGQIFGTGTLATLLSAALDHIYQRNAPAAVQCAYALGAVELMTGEGEHIDVLLGHVDFQMAHSLDGVGVENYTGLTADGTDFGNGQHRADLVVGIHHGDQAGIRANSSLHLLSGDVVTLGHIQISDFKAFLFQPLEGVQHGMVLKGGGDDVLFVFPCAKTGSGDDGLIVRLAAAGGEGDFSGLAAQALGYGFTGCFQSFLGFLANGVQAGRVAVNFIQIGGHGFNGYGAHGSGSGIVCIYIHGSISSFYLVFP